MDHHSVNHVNSLYQHVLTADYVKTAEIVSNVLMSEPPLDDDIALDKDADCKDCGNFVIECSCYSEPDRMYGDEN